MNKILLNICLVLVTVAVIYTILTLPATLNQTIRTEAGSMMADMKGEVVNAMNERIDVAAGAMSDKLMKEVTSRFDKIVPSDLTDEEINKYLSDLASDIIRENFDVKLDEQMLVDALKKILKDSISGLE